jgi:hypothetical protein
MSHHRGDVSILERVLADDYSGTSPVGKAITKAGAIAELKSGANKLESNDTDNYSVRVFGDTADARLRPLPVELRQLLHRAGTHGDFLAPRLTLGGLRLSFFCGLGVLLGLLLDCPRLLLLPVLALTFGLFRVLRRGLRWALRRGRLLRGPSRQRWRCSP